VNVERVEVDVAINEHESSLSRIERRRCYIRDEWSA